jgi:hypothetical protein
MALALQHGLDRQLLERRFQAARRIRKDEDRSSAEILRALVSGTAAGDEILFTAGEEVWARQEDGGGDQGDRTDSTFHGSLRNGFESITALPVK